AQAGCRGRKGATGPFLGPPDAPYVRTRPLATVRPASAHPSEGQRLSGSPCRARAARAALRGRGSPRSSRCADPGRALPRSARASAGRRRSEEHTSELQSRENLVCRLLLEKKNLFKHI